MTVASDQSPPLSEPTEAPVPAAGAAPVAPPAAGYVGAVIALVLLGIGVIALRDGAVAAGWLGGDVWTSRAIDWIDGLSAVGWMIPAGIVLILLGVWSVVAAVRPRRRTAVAVAARSSIWITPADLARLSSHAAESVPGVLDARSSATLRRITVTARTTADGGGADIKSAVTEAIRSAATIVESTPKIRVRTRTESA